jgi:alginate O-acetyltransferase complex protein AlgI
MSFSSLAFFGFFSVLFLLYFKLAKKHQWLLLLAASAYFYLSWVPAYGLLMLFTTTIAYFTAQKMEAWPGRRKLLLSLCLIALFGVLFLFKYFNFFSLTLTDIFALFDMKVTLPSFKLLTPLGLSFYTFQTAGYLIDVYRRKIKAEKNFGILALFVSFFPLVSAGPIERAPHLLPQLRKQHEFEYERVVSGLQLLFLGLFKKVIIADNIGLVVNHVFDSLPEYRGLSLVLTIFLFSWQIYCDFSGYTDMARGIARMLGFDILENFKTPYFATSIGDFWRRWHISLSTWFKDYLYIPLGGNRHGLVRTCLNTFIVFTLCGLWHGASWNFVLWGLFHGFFLSLQRVFAHFNKDRIKFPKLLSMAVTYGLICISWVFFRAKDLNDSIYILRNSLVGIRNFISPSYIWSSISQMFTTNLVEIAIVAFCLLTIITLELLSLHKSSSQILAKQPTLIRWSFYTSAVALLFLLRNANITTFIYIQF